MKKLFPFLFALIFFVGACSDDDDVIGPVFNNEDIIINFDDENFSAPLLPAGEYEMAVRFPESMMNAYVGKFLREVAVYLTNVPASTEIYIYETGSDPSSIVQLYQADVSASVEVDSWNVHVLNNPVEISGKDFWISIKVDHPLEIGSVGCDPGPAKEGGDFMVQIPAVQWTTLREYTNGLTDINWNIRGNITD